MTQILFIAATQEETAAVKQALGNDTVVVQSGIGNVPTMINTLQAIRRYKPQMVVQVGTAGAVTKDLKVGEVVIVCEDSNSDLGAYRPKSGLFEPFEQELYLSDFVAEGYQRVSARTVTCACTPYQRDEKQIETMEGAGFMAMAACEGVAFAQIRTVSNYTDDNIEDWREAEALESLSEALRDIFGGIE